MQYVSLFLKFNFTRCQTYQDWKGKIWILCHTSLRNEKNNTVQSLLFEGNRMTWNFSHFMRTRIRFWSFTWHFSWHVIFDEQFWHVIPFVCCAVMSKKTIYHNCSGERSFNSLNLDDKIDDQRLILKGSNDPCVKTTLIMRVNDIIIFKFTCVYRRTSLQFNFETLCCKWQIHRWNT